MAAGRDRPGRRPRAPCARRTAAPGRTISSTGCGSAPGTGRAAWRAGSAERLREGPRIFLGATSSLRYYGTQAARHARPKRMRSLRSHAAGGRAPACGWHGGTPARNRRRQRLPWASVSADCRGTTETMMRFASLAGASRSCSAAPLWQPRATPGGHRRGVNVRAGPESGAQVLRQVNRDEPALELDRQGDWVRVRLPDRDLRRLDPRLAAGDRREPPPRRRRRPRPSRPAAGAAARPPEPARAVGGADPPGGAIRATDAARPRRALSRDRDSAERARARGRRRRAVHRRQGARRRRRPGHRDRGLGRWCRRAASRAT